MRKLMLALFVAAVGVGGCTPDDASQQAVQLGPVDGRDLPGSDLDRVKVGDSAPDFSLVSLAGPVVTLSSFRGKKDVILVFYRGWW
jgi:hypothetical protein